MMLHLRNNTGFKHVFVPEIQDFVAYLEENLFLIWVSEGETWNLLYRNTGPDLEATQKQEGSMKKTNNKIQWPLVRFDFQRIYCLWKSRISLNINYFKNRVRSSHGTSAISLKFQTESWFGSRLRCQLNMRVLFQGTFKFAG